MANSLKLLPALIFALSAISVSAQQFVSIDCGANDTYVDPLGFKWVSDEEFVQTGKIAKVQIDSSAVWASPSLTTLRYFPSGKKKNCFTFPGVGQGKKILLRASFYYGNYDGLSSPPVFGLQFDGNEWSPVYTFLNAPAVFEMIYVTKVENISVCVAQTLPNNTTFISSLELRSLDSAMYGSMDTNYALFTQARRAYGSAKIVRYPDDPYDRFWLPQRNLEALGLTPQTNTIDPETLGLNDKPPVAALRQAVKPLSDSASNLTIPNPFSSSTPVTCFLNMYFYEAPQNGTRAFNLLLDNQLFYSKLITPNQTVLELFNPKRNLSSDSVFVLMRDNSSALPPIINAAEFFTLSDNVLTTGTDNYDVKALRELQHNYVKLQAWNGDPCLPTGFSWEWLNCSSDPTPRVTALYLSGYGLNGSLADFGALTALQIIDLHNNSLSGGIPDFLGKFAFLTELNLANNQLSGTLPSSLAGNSRIRLNVSGNNLTTGNSTITTSKSKSKTGVVAGSIIVSILVLFALSILAFFIIKKSKRNETESTPGGNMKQRILESETNNSFTHAQILDITNNFEMVIGEGGSGKVFYGRLRDGSEVAVKVLNQADPHGTKEFVAEVKLLMTVHHKCLVSFMGYCEEGTNLILVYEYMGGGNLRQLLSGGEMGASAFLSWEKRLQIALNVATGLDYLHSGCQPPIIHRDVKTTNILLTGKLVAKVADFGLSKVGPNDDASFLSTVIAGTPGYIDPEYSRTNLLTKKSDVYSFGVVLFELISGRPPIFAVAEDRIHVSQWVMPGLIQGDLDGVADPKLRRQYNVNSVWKVAELAVACTSQTSNLRPTMNDVVSTLKEAMEMEVPPSSTFSV